MQIKIIQDTASRFLKDNVTIILTAGGVVGTVTTAVLAGRAAFRAAQIIEEKVEDQRKLENEPLLTSDFSKTTKLQWVWPQFIPPVLVGSATIGSIIGANRMSAQKAAALAAAYGISQKQLDEYKAKLAEKLGVQKLEKAKVEMAQERVNNTPDSGAIVIYGDEVLCFDAPTGRYFKSTMEKINRAVNATNSEILKHNYAPASMFYAELELPSTTWANDVGWSMPFQLDISTVIAQDAGAENGKPCIVINFDDMPHLDYQRGNGGVDRYS